MRWLVNLNVVEIALKYSANISQYSSNSTLTNTWVHYFNFNWWMDYYFSVSQWDFSSDHMYLVASCMVLNEFRHDMMIFSNDKRHYSLELSNVCCCLWKSFRYHKIQIDCEAVICCSSTILSGCFQFLNKLVRWKGICTINHRRNLLLLETG